MVQVWDYQEVTILLLRLCEYRRHFLSYHPDYAIMTNIDFDHPDYFKNIDDVYDAFQHMALNVKKELLLGVMMNIYVN